MRAIAAIGAAAPALWLAARAGLGDLGPRPLTEAIHFCGLWALRLLALTLAVSPLAALMRWPRLIAVRRILGDAVFAYAALHIVLFTADKMFDLTVVAQEIVKRFYLSVGVIAFVLLVPLAATSTDAAVRRLGPHMWRRLHKLVYIVAALALVHFTLQVKLDISEPVAMAAIFFLLALLRAPRLRREPLTISFTIFATIIATFTAMLAEAGWFAAHGAPFFAALADNMDFSEGARPGWAPAVVGAVFVVLALFARLTDRVHLSKLAAKTSR
ncbi:MAG: ferric reductase-like transmembrane domain-containing protein [Hyphomicrobiales bacterium]|nr:ferric reductase-like transmembrane domain-containing protein [Hyphomicrobiales bacterium]